MTMQLPVFSTGFLAVNIFLFVIGLFLLIKGSDYVITGSVQLAKRFNIPEIIVGLTLVSVGTSMPEFATDIYAALYNEGAIVTGDLIGSNITNITLILGIGVTLAGCIKTPGTLFRRDVLFMLGTFLLTAALSYIGKELSRVDGMLLLLSMVIYLIWLCRHPKELESIEHDEPVDACANMNKAWLCLIGGFIMITSGAKLIVDNVVWGASELGMSKGVIAATVIAFGTSLPELAVTIGGVLKKKDEVALGNIIGSCIFNLLLIAGLCACISPIPMSHGILSRDIPLMLLSGGLLAVFLRSGWKLVRLEGIFLLFIYITFIIWNIFHIKIP